MARIYSIEASKLEELQVPMAAIDRAAPIGGVGSRHTMMMTANDVVTVVEIAHRILRQADGSFCDAPIFVRIGFGSSRRVAYLARTAAADPCVHREMLAHEYAHARSFSETVDRFIIERREDFQRGMVALKQMPAATAEIAKARWKAGLGAIVSEAKRQLLTEIQAANAEVDSVHALTALIDACGGKIRYLEEARSPSSSR
jgi:hypothetical protein